MLGHGRKSNGGLYAACEEPVMILCRSNAGSVCVILLMLVTGWWTSARAEDAPPPPPLTTPLEALFVPAREWLNATGLPPFLRDTDLNVHFRSYYFNRTKPDDS